MLQTDKHPVLSSGLISIRCQRVNISLLCYILSSNCLPLIMTSCSIYDCGSYHKYKYLYLHHFLLSWLQTKVPFSMWVPSQLVSKQLYSKCGISTKLRTRWHFSDWHTARKCGPRPHLMSHFTGGQWEIQAAFGCYTVWFQKANTVTAFFQEVSPLSPSEKCLCITALLKCNDLQMSHSLEGSIFNWRNRRATGPSVL